MKIRPRNVSVSVVEVDGKIKVWGCNFTLDTPILRDGHPKEDLEKARAGVEKAIAAALSCITFELED